MSKNYQHIPWTDEQVSRFWDYESQFPENYFTFQVGKQVVSELSSLFANAKTALDYGAGLGFVVGHFLEMGLDTYALDFSPDSVKKINEKFHGSKNFMGAFMLNDLVEADARFDVIMINEVIEHLHEGYLTQTMENVRNLLSDTGVAIFTTPNDEDLSKSFVYCANCDHVFHRWQHVRSWSIDSLSSFVEKSGLKLVDIFTTNFCAVPITKYRKPSLSTRLKRVLAKGDQHNKFVTEGMKQPHLVCVVKKR